MENKSGKPEILALTPVGELRGLYVATVRGQKAVVVYVERNRGTAAARFASVTVGPKRITAGQKLAKLESAPLYVGLVVRVGKKIDQTYLVPVALFRKHACCEADFALGVGAREAYAKEGVAGIRFLLSK